MKKTLLVIGLVSLLVAPSAQAQSGRAQKETEAAAAGKSMNDGQRRHDGNGRALPGARFSGTRAALAAGTVAYDSGALSAATATSVSIGNQFDSALGNPLTASGSVTQVQVNMAAVGGSAAFFSMFDQVAGTAANPVSSFTIPLVTGSNTVTLSAAQNYVGTTFLAGIWNFTAGSDSVAVASGTVSAQGFHGMSINDIAGTGFSRPGTFNGTVRVTGNLLTIPVELTGFEIVD